MVAMKSADFARKRESEKRMERFDAGLLRRKCEEIFLRAGVPEKDAGIISETLTTTDMRGVHSHGVVRCARYIECLHSGGIRADAEPVLIGEASGVLRFSADGGLGIPASVKVADRLIERAANLPIAVATVNHSDHFGAAGYYTMRGADAGLVMFCMSNTVPLLAAPGGRAAVIGNNPFAYSAPGKKYRALLFDICMSKVASGKIEIAAKEGRAIPEDWILNSKGVPTTDPQDIYRNGIMLPFAEHKGYGFAVMVELLTGILGDAGLLSGVHSWNRRPGRDADTGHCFIALNPEFFGGSAYFRSRVDAMIDELKRSPVQEGQRVLYPGELELERELDARQNGIPLPDASVRELKRAAELTHVSLNLEQLKTDQKEEI